jgi:hypothetical protein
MNYEYLTADEQKQMIAQRIYGYERHHFENELILGELPETATEELLKVQNVLHNIEGNILYLKGILLALNNQLENDQVDSQQGT